MVQSSIENAVGILTKGIFHNLDDYEFFALVSTISAGASWRGCTTPLSIHGPPRETERKALQAPPDAPYEHLERLGQPRCHTRIKIVYYSVEREHLHKEVLTRASVFTVKIYTKEVKHR